MLPVRHMIEREREWVNEWYISLKNVKLEYKDIERGENEERMNKRWSLKNQRERDRQREIVNELCYKSKE